MMWSPSIGFAKKNSEVIWSFFGSCELGLSFGFLLINFEFFQLVHMGLVLTLNIFGGRLYSLYNFYIAYADCIYILL